jgi:hypothetical protein
MLMIRYGLFNAALRTLITSADRMVTELQVGSTFVGRFEIAEPVGRGGVSGDGTYWFEGTSIAGRHRRVT